MKVSELTQRRVSTARVKWNPYFIHDAGLRGFCMKVAPSGRKTFVVNITRDGVRHRETIGDAAGMTLKEARSFARKRIAELTETHNVGPDTPFELVAEMAMRRHERLWKPGTMRVNRDYLKNCVMPYFRGRPIGTISRRDVEDWFAGLSGKPAAANRSVPVLSTVMREAEASGARPEGSNPAIGVRHYRNRSRERVLTADEMARLGKALDLMEGTHPRHTAIVRLIILTGCRVEEIRSLNWSDYRAGHLHLSDSKTGPKTVFLSFHARAVLESVNTPRTGPVFPRVGKNGRSKYIAVKTFWQDLRRDLGMSDVRLHDLRHNFASVALRTGENLTVIGKLLGHSQPQTTMRYAHLDDSMMREAVDVVGEALSRNKGGM